MTKYIKYIKYLNYITYLGLKIVIQIKISDKNEFHM